MTVTKKWCIGITRHEDGKLLVSIDINQGGMSCDVTTARLMAAMLNDVANRLDSENSDEEDEVQS